MATTCIARIRRGVSVNSRNATEAHNEIADNGTPLRSLIRSRWALLEFNHRADVPLTVPEVGEAVAYLTQFGAMLEQCYLRIDHALRGLLTARQISIGYGSPHEGNPEAAVAAATAALNEAIDAAELMSEALCCAQDAVRYAKAVDGTSDAS
jgi:hypothetical protein